MRFDRFLAELRRTLEKAGIEGAATDARYLLAHAAQMSAATLLASSADEVPADVKVRAAELIARRAGGEPVHRIIGHREFYGRRFVLGPETLEPRPDTEALVDLVLPTLRASVLRKGSARILDLGTGTGAIAITLLCEVAGATAVATDISQGALEVARGNASALHVGDRFSTALGPWFEPVTGTFDLIVSNPPYIESRRIEDLDRAVRDHDPRAALDGGEDGLDAYRKIAAGSGRHLATGGMVAVEIGYGQGDDVAALFEREGFRTSGRKRDLGGHERALSFETAVAVVQNAETGWQ